MSLTKFKRVVTGHNEKGEAIIVSADIPPTIIEIPLIPETFFYEIWNTKSTPAIIDNGADPTLEPMKLPPPTNGSRIRVVDIPPDAIQEKVSDEEVAAAFAAMGVTEIKDDAGEKKHRIMHRTETIDYGILVAGELWLIVDDGEVKLNVGDIVVQRGTNHAWSNRTDQTARMVFILLDGKFAEEIK